MQTFKIYTLGCKVNQYDSQVVREQFERLGISELDNKKAADYYVINTCTVTNSADSQSRYLIRQAKRENPKAKVVVTGCYAHLNGGEIKKIEGVDLILDNNNKHRIAEYFSGNGQKEKKWQEEKMQISSFKGHTRAFVKIQDGCNNFCSFCKVPYVRGRSRSREIKSIIEEINNLSKNGYKEIVLTGICLGDYGKDLKTCPTSDAGQIDLVDLIEEIEKIEGILRIRLSSIEARDVAGRLIKKMKESKKLCPHLHIAFQSGDNGILRLMNRKDAQEGYLALTQKLKENIKDIAITVDIMIGFANETDKQFLNTLEFLKRIEPARAHIFTFNPRDYTKMSDFKNTIPSHILKQRFNQIKKLTEELSLDFKRRFLSRTLQVLTEDKKNGFWRGYSQNYLLVYLNNNGCNLAKNELCSASIEEISSPVLYARQI